MRIDLVITELFVGGAEKCLTELAIGLHAHGDDIRVFSVGSLPTGEKASLVDRLKRSGIPITSANADRPTEFFSAKRKLADWLSHSRPQICQSFLFHANCLSAMTAGKSGVGALVGGLRVAESNALRCLLERQAVKKMNSLVSVSHAVARFAQERLGCDGEKSLVIPNGVDASRFGCASPISWNEVADWPNESEVVLFVGRFHPQKGLELIRSQIDAIATPGSNRKMLFVGEGPLGPELEKWAARVGHQRCRVLPWHSDVAPLMKSSRVLVLPSRYEGMPNVVLEAMAAGIPVVCSRVQGSEELLQHEWESQSFDSGDSAHMAKLIDSLMSDRDNALRIGQLNQQRVRTDFSIPTMIDSYRQLYRQLLR